MKTGRKTVTAGLRKRVGREEIGLGNVRGRKKEDSHGKPQREIRPT